MDLILYYRHNCGYCILVLRYLESNKISIPMKNVLKNSQYREELIELAGKTQVPCLVIDGKPMHESKSIIEWLQNNYKGKDK